MTERFSYKMLDELFAAAKDIYPGWAHLCWWEGKFQILPRKHTLTDHPIIRNLTSSQLQNGLTPREWENTVNQMTQLMEECINNPPQPPEPDKCDATPPTSSPPKK